MACHCCKWSPCECPCRHQSSTSWRCSSFKSIPPLLLLLMTLRCCSAQWVEKPENASQRLGLNVTFNCSSGPGQGDVLWAKIDDDTGTLSTLFINEQSWNTNATRHMRAVAMSGGGVSLTVTSLERNDDARYYCTISNTGLSHTVRLTVLGMSLLSYYTLYACFSLYV